MTIKQVPAKAIPSCVTRAGGTLVRRCVKLYHKNPTALHVMGDACALSLAAGTVVAASPLLLIAIFAIVGALAFMLFA